MIYKLEIANFYSVREPQVIDLTVGRKVPHEIGRLASIHDGSEDRAPRVIAIYGANASGKSNVLRAIAFLSWFIQSSFQHTARTLLPYQKFLTAAQRSEPTKLSFSFAGPEEPLEDGASKTCPYIYSLELDGRCGAEDRVLRESLHYRPSGSARMLRIFERDEAGGVTAAPWLGTRREVTALETVLRPDASVIATLGQLNNQLALSLLQVARSISTNISIPQPERNDFDLLADYARSPELLSALNRDIRRMGLGIDQVEILAEHRGPIARFTQAGLDLPIPMQFVSHGVQQLFRVYPSIYRALAVGGVAVIDELDVAMHPSVLVEILRWFADPERNTYGAQIWVSGHAVSLLGGLLKEEVLFCEKGRDGATEIYRLGDIRGIRRNENFLQNYLRGVYGGVPCIG